MGAYDRKVFRPITSVVKARMHYICQMLNYILVSHCGIYRIDHVFSVTKDMLASFFMDYAMKKSYMEPIWEARA